MRQGKIFFYFWLPALFYAGLIFAASSYSLSFPPALGILPLDRFLHTLEYGILGYLLGRAFLKGSPPFFQKSFQAWAASVAIFYGFTDEIHQYFVPMRQSSPVDLLCDGLGAVLAQFFLRRF